MTKNKNRRSFFRIYDEVHLFYKKIDEKRVNEPYSTFDNSLNNPASSFNIEMISQNSELLSPDEEIISPDVKTPDSEIKENKTHDVNISVGGMGFICERALKEGDYLIIKIVLVSSMAVIVTYGKVVFCEKRQANDSQYPYFVGVHFVNMKDKDRELLIKYVDKKRQQQKWVNGLLLAAVLAGIVAPDMVFSLLFELFHFLFEHILEFSHIAFEVVESTLDEFVEHLFHTDLQQTQLIVFYILVSLVVCGLYLLWRVLPPFCRHSKESLIAICVHKKANLLSYWWEQSLLNKIKLVVIGIAIITLYVFFGL
ncbi:MAG: PilZ domain-containing protein [Methylobacter sp.]|nr:PilZ domain-containing protein [Methylobacter sp.]